MGGVIETEELTRDFGGVRAVDHVSVSFKEGEIVGIIGANGSGKTTFLNLITGYVRPTKGRVYFRGKDITGLGPEEIIRRGIGRSFQIPQLYPQMSVLENILVGLAIRDKRVGWIWESMRLAARVEEAEGILEDFGLCNIADRPVRTLSEGERKVLDVALSFALSPQVLLLDEPTSGVGTKEKFSVMEKVVNVVRKRGITMVFVEHDLDIVAVYAKRILVFKEGRVVSEGSPDELLVGGEKKGEEGVFL